MVHPSQQTLIQISIAFGDLSDPRYSSLEKLQLYFEEKSISYKLFRLHIWFNYFDCTFLFLIVDDYDYLHINSTTSSTS